MESRKGFRGGRSIRGAREARRYGGRGFVPLAGEAARLVAARGRDSVMDKDGVVVFGYGELSTAAVEALEAAGARVSALVLPSNRAGEDVETARAFAERRSLPVLVQPPRKSVEPFVESLRELSPALILVWSYSMILPPSVIGTARTACVNVHGGLLPEYRGGHVMQWALINGEWETGATLHYVDEGVDTGPVIAEERFPIEPEDDANTVRQKLKGAGARLIKEWWPAVAQGTAPRVEQDESRARYYRLRTAEDGFIDWSATSAGVYNLVRALVRPWPGAFTFWGERKIVVRRVEPVGPAAEDGRRRAPGTVCEVEAEGVRVATGDGEVVIREAEYDGRAATADDLKNLGLAAGDSLGGIQS